MTEVLSVDILRHYLLGLTMLMPRIITIFSIVPFLGKILHGQVRNSIVAGLCLLILPVIMPTVHAQNFSLPLFMGLMAKEALVGFLIGFFISIPFWAIEGVGSVIDNQRGSTMGSLFDPMAGQQTSVYGSLFMQLTAVLLFTSGGFLTLVGIMFQSYKIWPVDSFIPAPTSELPTFILGQLDYLMRMIVIYAAPPVIAIFLVDFGLGLINRFAPQLNVFFLSMPLKSGVAVFIVFIYLVMVQRSFSDRILEQFQAVKFLQYLFK